MSNRLQQRAGKSFFSMALMPLINGDQISLWKNAQTVAQHINA
jgi:hypothetical protein